MDSRDRQALVDIQGVLDRALGYSIHNEETFVAKDYLQDTVIRCLEILGEATKRLALNAVVVTPICPDGPWQGCEMS